MSRQRLQVEKIKSAIDWADSKESQSISWYERSLYWTIKWALMIAFESTKDNAKVRAESLAYLMLFSIVPLIAGAFFVFSFFSQFAFVQESLQSGINQFLSNFPKEHQEIILEYGVTLKDRYLSTVSAGSTKFGIFASGVFLYVGVQTFNNVESTINYIWGSERVRPLLEKIRNFLVIAIVAPLAITASLSVPLIIRATLGTTIDGVVVLSFIESFIGWGIPIALTFLTFLFIYKYIPVRNVPWRAAIVGAICGSVGLQIANGLVSLYVRFATHTAYGKAAVFLVLGFWIYIVWFIVITGAQISYLASDGKYLLKSRGAPPSMYEGYSLLIVLGKLLGVYQKGANPICYSDLFEVTKLNAPELRRVMSFLEDKKFVAKVAGESSLMEGSYLLARDLRAVKPSEVLEDFMKDNIDHLSDGKQIEEYKQSYKQWSASFDSKGFEAFVC